MYVETRRFRIQGKGCVEVARVLLGNSLVRNSLYFQEIRFDYLAVW
jgi:hypothetical protein